MTRPLSVFVAFLFIATSCASASPALGGRIGGGSAPFADSAVASRSATKWQSSDAGVVLIPAGGASLSSAAGGQPFMRASEGLIFGFQHRDGEWLEVTTTCDDPAWVHESAVEVTPQSVPAIAGIGFDLSAATIVLDPGHGDRDWGGVGPNGLVEKAVNLDIAARIQRLMLASHNVDWVSGAVTPGSNVPAFGTVWMTRSEIGPNDGDYELGLGFRAELANAAGAAALISIHNNTVPRITTSIPGTEVYYAVGAEGSDRLAGLIYEEMLKSFAAYSANWTGGEVLGARARVDPATGNDYYGILRRAEMPAVIVEGLYISEPDEEALLATEAFRQSYAEAVYRGAVRFLMTAGQGAGINPPEPFPEDAGTVTGSGCEVPAQP